MVTVDQSISQPALELAMYEEASRAVGETMESERSSWISEFKTHLLVILSKANILSQTLVGPTIGVLPEAPL